MPPAERHRAAAASLTPAEPAAKFPPSRKDATGPSARAGAARTNGEEAHV